MHLGHQKARHNPPASVFREPAQSLAAFLGEAHAVALPLVEFVAVDRSAFAEILADESLKGAPLRKVCNYRQSGSGSLAQQ